MMKRKRLILSLLTVALIALCSHLFAQDTAPASDKETAAQAAEFKPNPTFDDAIRSALRKTRTPFLTRVKVWLAMRNDEVRYEMELALTEKALEMGVLQPEGVDGAGVYGNPWTDFLDWIIANWDDILKIIMTIVDIFTDTQPADVGVYNWPADEILFCSLSAPQCAGPQCSGGSCAVATSPSCQGGACQSCAPMATRSVLVRRSTPAATTIRSRTVTAWRRPYQVRRGLLFRRYRVR